MILVLLLTWTSVSNLWIGIQNVTAASDFVYINKLPHKILMYGFTFRPECQRNDQCQTVSSLVLQTLYFIFN